MTTKKTSTKKKTTKISPTQLTMAWLRRKGMTAQVVERWNPFAKIRQDLFQVIDIVAVSPTAPILGVQVTTRGNMSARKAKIRQTAPAALWATWASLEVHGWQKVGPRWTLRVCEMRYDPAGAKWVENEFDQPTARPKQ